MIEKVQEVLKGCIKKLYDIEIENISLDAPPKKELGDFAFGCFVLSKDLKKNPIQVAAELAENITHSSDINNVIEFAKSEGPYINIKLNKKLYTNIFYDINKILRGNFSLGKSETVFIDYIGANVGKPLHIGHMCTPNIGQALINGYKKLGYKVVSDSHIGDWGIIFGKLLCAYKHWGDKKKLINDAVEHLLELYIKITAESEKDSTLEEKFRAEFKSLVSGDGESVELWKEFTSYSIESMQKQLDRLNIQPDYNIGESFYEGIGLPKLGEYPDLKYTMSDIVKELVRKGIATKNDDNSVGVVFDENLKIPSCVLQKRDGTHGYLASDLACIKYRVQNWSPSKIVYCVDVRQKLHFTQAFTIAKQAGWLENIQLIHASNGFISLKDGAMSTRKGKIIKLNVLLDEAEERAKKILLEKREDIESSQIQNLARIIGIGAIKYGYLKKSRETDVVFDFDEFISFEGNSAPYIQYAYVRAKRILENAGVIEDEKFYSLQKDVVFENDEEVYLVRLLGEYKQSLEDMVEKNMPHILCAYIYTLTKSFSAFYNKVHILNETDGEKKYIRLQLVALFGWVIKDALTILGIEVPEKM